MSSPWVFTQLNKCIVVMPIFREIQRREKNRITKNLRTLYIHSFLFTDYPTVEEYILLFYHVKKYIRISTINACALTGTDVIWYLFHKKCIEIVLKFRGLLSSMIDMFLHGRIDILAMTWIIIQNFCKSAFQWKEIAWIKLCRWKMRVQNSKW